jgi:Leucine-rich repeat (LRR) protein
MDLIKTKFPPPLLESFSERLTKLYLNFGMVESLGFVELFPNMKVLYVRNNKLNSLKGVETLKKLGVICFDNNMVNSMEPLAELVDMTQISGTGNKL